MSKVTFGLDIGTTSVAGVAVDDKRGVVASVTLSHGANLPSRAFGVDEQDPERLLDAARAVLAELEAQAGAPECIGWTGQMHGVVAVDRAFRPVTPFVTWRDARRYGGEVMRGWSKEGLKPFVCLSAPSYAIAHLDGRAVIDPTFLESWHLEGGGFPREWLPEVVEGVMLGDNQAGVYAAQELRPGCAVVNIGTSAQISLVCEATAPLPTDSRLERRTFVDGKALLCRASRIGGQALARLRDEMGIGWDELNARAESDTRISGVLDALVDDLVGGLDLSHATGLVGVGNALRLNSALKAAVERRFGLTCLIPDVTEMAAYGAALYVHSRRSS